MKKQENIIFESYNKMVDEAFNNLISKCKASEVQKLSEERIIEEIKKEERNWEKSSISDIGGVSPLQYVNSIENENELEGLFINSARFCDSGIPDIISDRLVEMADKMAPRLLEIANNRIMRRDDSDISVCSAAIEILGLMKNVAVVKPLINILNGATDDEELIMEQAARAIEIIGFEAKEELLNYLNSLDFLTIQNEYLVPVLARITDKSENVFITLKNAFRNMKNKVVGAQALYLYGDARAVTILRSYLESNVPKVDPQVFYEVKIAIEGLGGNIEGIEMPKY